MGKSTALDTGKDFKSEWIHVFTVKNGKVTRGEVSSIRPGVTKCSMRSEQFPGHGRENSFLTSRMRDERLIVNEKDTIPVEIARRS